MRGPGKVGDEPHILIKNSEIPNSTNTYIKVHKATRWTIRHGLMLLWFKDLTNVTKKFQFIDPMF